MVASVKKNGDLRICIDLQALNSALKRELYPLPVIDDILPDLNRARIFSKFDLKNGYWHCVLNEESSFLTAIQTDFVRYRWKRLPFGPAVSSEIFHKKLMQALEGLEGTMCVADDILIYGTGESAAEAEIDLDKKVNALLKRCAEVGIKLNKVKAEMKKLKQSFVILHNL